MNNTMTREEFFSISKRYFQGSLRTVTRNEYEKALDELIQSEKHK